MLYFPRQILFFLSFFCYSSCHLARLSANHGPTGLPEGGNPVASNQISRVKRPFSCPPLLPSSPPPLALPRSPGCVPYITPSVPGCELRCLVSILPHRAHRRNAACLLFICLCLESLSFFLFVLCFFWTAFHLKKKTWPISLDKRRDDPLKMFLCENGA